MRSVLVIVALAAGGCAQLPGQPQSAPPDDAATLAAAETAFAAHSVREDMRAAFLAHFADDGVFVRDGWVNSKAYLATQGAPPIVLEWRPVHTEVAASGELGLSTGPWKATSKARPDAPPTYGQYVSIWRRAPGEPWKVVVDLGISHPKSALWDAPLDTSTRSAGPARSSRGIEGAELDFVSDAHVEGLTSAYAKHGSPGLRFYRNGVQPAIGRIEAIASPAMKDEKLAWVIDQTEIASSGDFGYTRGSYSALATPARPLGYFLRVWRAERGEWRIVLDVTNPAGSP
jgi:ketosteroid isomerase-like protein